MSHLSRVKEILQDVLAECAESPIDLLDIGDMAGETTYLLTARQSYERTLEDISALIAPRLAAGQRVRVLEVGAYLGVVSLALARLGCDVTALDIPEFMDNRKLQERYRQAGISMVSVNLKDYPLPVSSAHYDLVVMCETLEHLNFNPLPVLAEMNRGLQPEGLIYLALPNLASLPNRFHLLCGDSLHNPVEDFRAQLSRDGNMIVGLHWREYTRKELFELLGIVNFQVESHAYLYVPGSSLPARLIYKVFPAMRPAQALTARKGGEHGLDFRFTAATR